MYHKKSSLILFILVVLLNSTLWANEDSFIPLEYDISGEIEWILVNSFFSTRRADSALVGAVFNDSGTAPRLEEFDKLGGGFAQDLVDANVVLDLHLDEKNLLKMKIEGAVIDADNSQSLPYGFSSFPILEEFTLNTNWTNNLAGSNLHLSTIVGLDNIETENYAESIVGYELQSEIVTGTIPRDLLLAIDLGYDFSSLGESSFLKDAGGRLRFGFSPDFIGVTGNKFIIDDGTDLDIEADTGVSTYGQFLEPRYFASFTSNFLAKTLKLELYYSSLNNNNHNVLNTGYNSFWQKLSPVIEPVNIKKFIDPRYYSVSWSNTVGLTASYDYSLTEDDTLKFAMSLEDILPDGAHYNTYFFTKKDEAAYYSYAVPYTTANHLAVGYAFEFNKQFPKLYGIGKDASEWLIRLGGNARMASPISYEGKEYYTYENFEVNADGTVQLKDEAYVPVGLGIDTRFMFGRVGLGLGFIVNDFKYLQDNNVALRNQNVGGESALLIKLDSKGSILYLGAATYASSNPDIGSGLYARLAVPQKTKDYDTIGMFMRLVAKY